MMTNDNTAAAKPIINLSIAHGETVKADLDGFVERPIFTRYLNACKEAGAFYDPKHGAQTATLDDVPTLIAELEKEGFDAHVADCLSAKLTNKAETIANAADVADARIADTGLSLFPFQREGVRWLASRKNACLFDEMGLGKTVQALAAIETGPVIVVCPNSVKGVWLNECKRWRPDLTPVILKGRASFRFPLGNEMIIINYDILPHGVDFTQCRPGTTLIADEAHALKNKKAKRTRKFHQMRDAVEQNDGKTWLLTGTPLLNYPPELWNVLSAANLQTDAFGGFGRFCRAFNARRSGYGTDWGKPTAAAATALKKVSLRRHRKDVLPELPAKMYDDRRLERDAMTAETVIACEQAMAALAEKGIDIEAGDFTLEELAAAGFSTLSKARNLLAISKIPAMLEIVEAHEEEEQPLVVASYHRAPVETLGEREGWEMIAGGVDADERAKIVERFQNGELKGLAVTIQAGGTGLTLTHAHRMLFVDLAWTPALNEQMEDRICRIGQDTGCQITTLTAANSLDERVNTLLFAKRAIITASVDASAVDSVTTEADNLKKAAQKKVAKKKTSETAKKDTAGWSHADTPWKEWIEDSIVALASNDGDRAREKNDVGFNAFDGDFGHSLAERFNDGKKLSAKQWHAAARLLKKYHRQIGKAPALNADEQAYADEQKAKAKKAKEIKERKAAREIAKAEKEKAKADKQAEQKSAK